MNCCKNCFYDIVCERPMAENESCIDFVNKADFEPVKRGKWEVVRTHNNFIKHMYKCSACEKNQFARSNYCPNCGAKMDGKEVQE